jgi:Hsp90 protein
MNTSAGKSHIVLVVCRGCLLSYLCAVSLSPIFDRSFLSCSCPPGQDTIYYLVAPHRGIAETSPYLEAFKGAGGGSDGGVEVLFLYSPLDDFVMGNLREYQGRKLVTVETADLDPTKLTGIKDKEQAKKELEKQQNGGADSSSKTDSATTNPSEASSGEKKEGGSEADQLTPLNDSQLSELSDWLRSSLPGRISKVRATTRLRSSPAVVTDHESAAVRRMMRMVEQTAGRDSEALRQEAHMLPAQSLEVNPAHPVIIRLHALRTTQPKVALMLAEQVVDNAFIAAGLVDDSRIMLPRLNALLELVAATASGSGADKAGSGYSSYQDLVSRRYVSEREEQDRKTLESSKQAVDETVNPDVLKAVEEAAKKVAAGKGKNVGGHPVSMSEPSSASSSSASSSSSSSASSEGKSKSSSSSSMRTGNNEVDSLLAELEKTLKEAGVDPSSLGSSSAADTSSAAAGAGRLGRNKGLK